MKSKNKFSFIAGIIGNLLEHYDTALFGLLVPVLAPIFFPKTNPIISLMLGYGILPLGLLTKPLGALFFGWIGDRSGRKASLFTSLSGTACVTMLMGSLPTYAEIGIIAPCLLALARMLQGFFAAGESAGGAILLLERNHAPRREGLLSSIYDASSLLGALLASILISWIPISLWRVPFWIGGTTAIVGIFLRITIKEPPILIEKKEKALQILLQNKAPLLRIILITGLCHSVYILAFPFMGGYLPLISSISFQEVTSTSPLLFLLDVFLLLGFGWLSCRVKIEKIMLFGSFMIALFSIPLFLYLENCSFLTMLGARVFLIVFGTCIAAPYYAWSFQQAPIHHRYLILAVGSCVGSQLIGASLSPLILWGYQQTLWPAIPAIPLSLLAILSSVLIYSSLTRKKIALSA